MRFFSAFVGFVLFLVGLLFALFNRQNVTVALWPFGLEMAAPLYVMVLAPLAFGLILGAAFIWIGHVPYRWKTRRLGKDVVALTDRLIELERELEKYRAEAVEKEPPQKLRWKFWN